MSALQLRDATLDDVAAITAIYRPYVMTSAATMEIDPPDEAEMCRRLGEVRGRGLPFLVAELEGEVVGYGYASPFRPRAGYRYTVEDSIYLSAKQAGRGYGRQILGAVVAECRKDGAKQMVAVIGGENRASVAMHAAVGFVMVGELKGVGWKFDAPQDIAMMQLAL